MGEIDDMDFFGFLQVRAWKAAREKTGSTSKKAYIDEVWPQLH